MSVHFPLHNVFPAPHAHTPPWQYVFPVQTTPHAPQCKLLQQGVMHPLLHCVCPGGHSLTQSPAEHTVLGGHALPQAPQLLEFDCMSTQ